MKNFNLKSILATILLLLGVSQTAWGENITEGTKLYLKVEHNDWLQNNERFAAYFYGGDGEQWISMTAVSGESNLYEVTAKGTRTNVIFCRMKGSTSENKWDNKWNQTVDLTYDGTKNMFTVNGKSDKYTGIWSTYTPSSSSNYTVFFNYNGGSGTTANLSCDKGKSITLPTPNDRTGYTFKGWYTAATDGTFVGAAGATYPPNANITLYAQWLKDYSADTYYYFDDKITKWDGSVGVLMTHAGDYAYVQRSAYNNTDNKFKIFPTNPKDDNNLTANSENIATGTLAGAIDLSDANDGWKNIKMPATTSDYFVILYYPNTATNPSSKYLVAASYTRPDASNYTVSFNYNGGSGATPSLSCDKGGNITLPTPNTREGYAFNGWYTAATGGTLAGAAGASYTPAGSLTLYAQWLKDDYSVDTYYYFDQQKTGWEGAVGVPMIHDGDYAYVQRPAYNAADNKFKIFPTNPKDDNNLTANSENIATGTLEGDIPLGNTDTEWHNILMPATTSDYFVILYYPNTDTNPSSKYLVAASYTLPDASTTKYRLVYVEKDANNGTIEKFHPSHIIKNHPEATAKAPMFDTVSMHVRLKLLKKKAVTGTTNVSYDTIANDNDCEVWLQEFKEVGSTMEWVTIQNINTKEPLTTNGVYNFIITQADGSATIEPTAIRPYTGRYYIRTDASDGGWHNYKQLSNYCYYTEYSRVYRGFDYYYCHWSKAGNIKYTIACDYSNCVSDTLAQEDHEPHNTFTDAHGTLTDNKNANVRFMWNSFDNTLDRAYIAGVGKEDNVFNLFLLSESGIYNMDGKTSAKEVKLDDQQNWVYCVDVKADSKARIKLRAVPYNGATSYSWFRGLDGDFSKANTEQLIEGKIDTRYTVRVIYDFKTDHLICAWIPDKDTITSDDVINADLMIIRTDQDEAAQLNFKPNQTKVTNITVAYCVLNLTKKHLDSSKTSKEKSCYWISFPFDVNLSDVFGCGKYGEDFIIQYYDGAERALKGCWADSPTYWKYITNPKGVLKKGMGYVLVIDYEKILREQFKHNNSSVNIYFPSSGPIDAIDGVLPTAVDVPKHECTIKRNDRYIYDSNWNIIGIPTWANIDKFGNPMKAVPSTSKLSQSGEEVTYTIGFYYAHDAVNNKWTVCDTEKVDFLSMYSYLVQWAGTINWKEKSASGEHHPTLAPRRYAPAEGEEEAEVAEAPEQYTLRLTLNRGEKQLDHTYVRLQEGNVTTDFDLNYDMTKILNDGTNLYSLVGTNLIQCAANVQPLQEDARTISIPLGVVADQEGYYTFSLPDGTEGMNVSIADFETGTVHNLALGDYQTALTKGTYEGRFALEIQPRQEVSTGCEQTDAAGKSLRKVLIDGNLYILRDGKAYTAAGKEL